MNRENGIDPWELSNILVSVVVPTYRRPELLDRCLEALVNQEFNPAAYEIIVVDDGASVETERLVAAWKQRPRTYALVSGQEARKEAQVASEMPAAIEGLAQPAEVDQLVSVRTVLHGVPAIHYLRTRGSCGPAAARNLGWRSALGEIIAFTDDDCLPEPTWLQLGVAAFEEDIAGVGGRMVVPLPERPSDYERDAAGLERSHFVTANCFYRSAALEAVGGFDETFRLAWREDSDLLFRLLEAGYRLVENDAVQVIHPVRPAPWGVSARQQRKSMYNALIYKKHPRLYRERLQPRPPLLYYAIVAALMVAAGGVLAGNTPVVLGALVTWAALTLALSARRLLGTSRSLPHVLEMLATSAVIPPLCVYWRLRGALAFRVYFL